MKAITFKHELGLSRWLVSLVVVLGAGSCSPGANAQKKAKLEKILTSEEAAAALDKLYERYLAGPPDEARASLLGADKYVELLQHGREHARFIQHARLHCLAKAIGNEDEASLEFMKASYWYLMDLEADNTSLKSARPPSELLAKTKEITERRLDEFVIEFDRANTKDGEAHYWKSLPKGATSAEQWLRSRYKE